MPFPVCRQIKGTSRAGPQVPWMPRWRYAAARRPAAPQDPAAGRVVEQLERRLCLSGSAASALGMADTGPTGGAAAADRFEPNDSLATATNFGTLGHRTEN